MLKDYVRLREIAGIRTVYTPRYFESLTKYLAMPGCRNILQVLLSPRKNGQSIHLAHLPRIEQGSRKVH